MPIIPFTSTEHDDTTASQTLRVSYRRKSTDLVLATVLDQLPISRYNISVARRIEFVTYRPKIILNKLKHPAPTVWTCYTLSSKGLPIMTLLVSPQAVGSPTVQSKRKGMLHCVHYYKDAMLGRFYAICNCCSCCCGAMNAWNNGTPMLASSGYVAQVDEDLCAACGNCADYCQFKAISVDNGYAVVDYEACMGCGVCVSKCPQEAISLLRDPARGEPLEIQKLIVDATATV